jgi:hypothetical protein
MSIPALRPALPPNMKWRTPSVTMSEKDYDEIDTEDAVRLTVDVAETPFGIHTGAQTHSPTSPAIFLPLDDGPGTFADFRPRCVNSGASWEVR